MDEQQWSMIVDEKEREKVGEGAKEQRLKWEGGWL